MCIFCSEKAKKWAICAAFYGLILCCHIPMTYVGDDAAWLKAIGEQDIGHWLVYHFQTNGRVCTDVLFKILLSLPLAVWKVLDSCVYVVIALLLSYLFTQNKPKDLLCVCGLILLFPFFYLSTAGYLAVSANYVYTFTCLLVLMLPFKRKLPVWGHALVLLAMVYASNHDQTAMVQIGGLFLYWLYLRFNDGKTKNKRLAAMYLAAAIVMYMGMFIMPGHINRMSSTVEMEQFLPEYAQWSFFKKVYHGYTSTVAHLFFDGVKISGLFCFFLFFLALQGKSMINKAVSAVPLGVFSLVRILGKEYFIQMGRGVPELYTQGARGIVALLLTAIMVGCVFYTVLAVIKSKSNRWLIMMLLVLAAGSRLMMGFSATIYASSYRTFTFFIYALIASNLLLIQELRQEKKMNMAMAAIGICLIV